MKQSYIEYCENDYDSNIHDRLLSETDPFLSRGMCISRVI